MIHTQQRPLTINDYRSQLRQSVLNARKNDTTHSSVPVQQYNFHRRQKNMISAFSLSSYK
jgi:hypothetical protein